MRSPITVDDVGKVRRKHRPKTPKPDCYWCKGTGKAQEEWYRGRNYALFARLADVRTGGGNITQHAPPRGFPPATSNEVNEKLGELDGDLHSHTWFLLSELLKIDWDKQTYDEERCVTQEGFAQWKAGGELDWKMTSTLAMQGEGIELTNIEMENLIESKVSLPRHWTRIIHREPYGEAFGVAIRELRAHARRKLDAAPDQVRMIFAFDN